MNGIRCPETWVQFKYYSEQLDRPSRGQTLPRLERTWFSVVWVSVYNLQQILTFEFRSKKLEFSEIL